MEPFNNGGFPHAFFFLCFPLFAVHSGTALAAGEPAKLVFLQQPSPEVYRGSPFKTTPLVALQDADGKTIVTEDYCQVTLALVSFEESGLLLANSRSRVVVAGLADFTGSELRFSADSDRGTFQILAQGAGSSCAGMISLSDEIEVR